MKKFVLNFFVGAVMIFSAALVSSCEKDDPKDDECETCDVCVDEPCDHDPCDCEEADVFFTVKFISDGVVANEFSVADGSKLTAPVLAPKAGFTFGGWYKDDDFVNAWNFASDVVGVDIALYAKWIVRDVVKLLETITENDRHTTFEYDDKNRITKKSVWDDGELWLTETLTYRGDDLIKFVRIYPNRPEDNSEVDFLIDGNVVTLPIDDDGYLISFEDDGFAQTYQYQDGNLIKWTQVQSMGNITHEFFKEYKYDDKKSPLYHSKTPKWFKFIILFSDEGSGLGLYNNNIVEETSSDNMIYKFEYEYDSDGFPTKQTWNVKVRDVEEYTGVRTFTYIIK